MYRLSAPYLQVMTATATRSLLMSQKERYTEGDCWVLAICLAERLSGWRVVSTPVHAFVVSPDGKTALDITGPKTFRAMLRAWNISLRQDADEIEFFSSPRKAKGQFVKEGWETYHNINGLSETRQPIDWKHAREMADVIISYYAEKL